MSAPLKPAVFLDRDGIINAHVYNAEFGTVDSPGHPSQFQLLPGAAEAVARLNRLGLLVVVVSNQPGIAKGRFNLELLQAMTEKMCASIEDARGKLDGIYYCLHHPQAVLGKYRRHCSCRKPQPGLLLTAATDLGIDLGRSYMIGDGMTDIAAGHWAATKTILVSSRKCYLCAALEERQLRPDFVVESLAQAARLVQAIERGDAGAGALACRPEHLAADGPLAEPYRLPPWARPAAGKEHFR